MMIRLALPTILLVVLLAGCASFGSPNNSGSGPSVAASMPALPDQPATVEGTITRAQNNAILVEEQPQQANGGRKIVFTIKPTTQIFGREGQALQPRRSADLMVGRRVQAWADGPIAESYPEQATAGVVLLVD